MRDVFEWMKNKKVIEEYEKYIEIEEENGN